MRKFIGERSLLAWAIVFAIVGVLARLLLHTMVESRLIIVFAWLLAMVLEYLLRPLFHLRPRNEAWLLNGIAATVGIVATKWTLEGFPHYLH